MKRGRGRSFELAVKECDTFIADGIVSIMSSHICWKNLMMFLLNVSKVEIGSNDGAIVVKEELDFVIKEESAADSNGFICSRQTIKKSKRLACTECNSKQMEIASLNETKKKMIQELTLAKQQCHTYFSKFQISERALDKTKKEYDALNSSNAHNENHVNILLQQKQEQADKIQRMAAEINRLSKRNENVQVEDDVYNIEKIVDHKKENRKLMFLVRWEGYDSSDDSWKAENDLMCPQMLKKYKKLHSL